MSSVEAEEPRLEGAVATRALRSSRPAPRGVNPDPAGPEALSHAHRVVKAGTVFFSKSDLDGLRRELRGARQRLMQVELDASERTAAEWYFDNEYIVQRALEQLEREFPAGFQRSLPRLSDGSRPRALVVARAILPIDRELDAEHLDAFLNAYQTNTPLTMAELWSLPVLLRLVVLRDLAVILVDVLRPGAVEGYDPGTVVGRNIRTLRLLADLDVKDLFCRHSATERELSADPAHAYPSMDFATRDGYRHAVEDLALVAWREEHEIARLAVALAQDAVPDGRQNHVGHWLVAGGRGKLEEELGARPGGAARWIQRAPRRWFFGLLVAAQLAFLGPVIAYLAWLGPSWAEALLAVAMCAIPASVPTATLVHWLLSKIVPPRTLAKLDFSEGIPRRWRTLVVIPSLLDDAAGIDRLLERIEVHYLSNPDPALSYALLTDHVDLAERPADAEQGLVERARCGIRALNGRHGVDGRHPFHLLHRESRWNRAEGRWMGWERKRGKLEELNRYLRGDPQTSYRLHEGDRGALEDVAFVLTLDSDTMLPPGAAARLVGALAHPLNRPVTMGDGRVADGYTIIQPRVEISPESANRSLFTRLFAGDTGIDIYTRAVSEVYQDLFGDGIYVGKGIYDIDAITASLEGRVPENALVSHDLFEGIHGRAALATDVVVYEDYPPHFIAYLHRMHRWVRGDWQLLPWLAPRVHTGTGTINNRLGLVDRFKIVDNLRRSLLAPSILALLLAGWFVLPGHPVFWMLVALLAPGAGPLWSTLSSGSLPRRDLGRWALGLGFVAQEAGIVLDAIGRTIFRVFVTHRRLLEWTTAAHVARDLATSRLSYLRRLSAGPLLAVAAAGLLAWLSPLTLVWASPILLLWLVSPEIALSISRPLRAGAAPLDAAAERYLRRAARRIWLFFETFVGPADQWLPPDHFQEEPRGAPVHRTSPTNIGMLLVSELAAYDLGYLATDELATRVGNTISTLERMERHGGHLFNWYDTETLAALMPKYVSTVDSGNLVAALLTLATGCERAVHEPLIRSALREGLRDTAELLGEAVEKWASAGYGDFVQGARAASHDLMDALATDGKEALSMAVLTAIRGHMAAIEGHLMAGLQAGDDASHDPAMLRELKVWLERLDHQIGGVLALRDRLLPEAVGPDASLTSIPAACAMARRGEPDASKIATLAAAEEAARELASSLGMLASRARALADGMDFRFLYDGERRLFHIGYDASADRLDPHYYDLLASEARIASLIAVMRHEVPIAHWFSMGRPIASVGHAGAALLSWGGSMFEYLMPALFMRSHPDTLLSVSCKAAVARQIAYGREHERPWGISESGYAFLDGQQMYQYRSFGVPGLGLRRGLEEDLVIAPYASFLALPFQPAEVVANLRKLEALGMVGHYGFFEAADFHPERAHLGRAAIVHSYMAHHHGMSLVALDNHLCRDVMVERFMADPRARSVALLLDERVPERAPKELPTDGAVKSTDVALTPGVAVEGWDPWHGSSQIWAIGNGTMTAMVTADGGGGLRYRDVALTRWQPDAITDSGGCFVYVLDRDDGDLFGATPAPVGDWPPDGGVRFEAGRIEFHVRRGSLRVRTQIAVAATEDVEVRELRVSNDGDTPRHLRVVGCIEPTLEPLGSAEQHPAFSKLFLRCRPLDDLGGFLVTRSMREGPRAPVLLFRMIGDAGTTPRPLAVDRGTFLGRWGSFARPAIIAANAIGPAIEGSLDPICASAVDLTVDPGTTRILAFVTVVGTTRSEAIDRAQRFGSTRAVRWAIEDAGRAAARGVARLGWSPALLPAAQRLLSALLSPEPGLRARRDVLRRSRPSQPALWGRGISGDEPIVFLRVSSTERSELADEVLVVHRYLRSLGVHFDLVLSDDAPSGYGEQGPSPLSRWLAERGAAPLLHQRGGVHIVRVDQTGGQDLLDLEAAAHVVLDARMGPGLAAHFAEPPQRPVELPYFEPPGPPPGSPTDPDVHVKVPEELAFDNGLGGFCENDYVVRPDARTPAPWCNVLANPVFGCLTSEGGLGSTWSLNAKENRLTPWRNDPVVDLPSEVLYLRDEETGHVWSTTPRPAGYPTLVRHGAGYTTYELACAGLEQRMTVFVPPEGAVKIVELRVRNTSARPRRLTATYYLEWVLGSDRRATGPHIRSEVVTEDACLLASNSWSLDFADRTAFLATNGRLHGFTADRAEFLGYGGDLARPAALLRWGLSGRIDPGGDPSGALQVHLDLPPNGSAEVGFFLGQADNREAALDVVRALRAPGAIEQAWRARAEHWDARLDAVVVRTPDPSMDRLLNRWLLYQALASRLMGRTAFYQSSGAFGFRDQLQDCLAMLQVDPGVTRAQILEAAAHQFVEGDVLHWWHPPGGAGVRTRCSDDLLWLVYTTAEYVEATGDESILDRAVPFLTAEELSEREETRYGRFAIGEGASLLEHCRRALTRGFTRGPHGLPLIGDGDWNDGMNRVGVAGRGESVWLGWFVHVCTTRFARVLERVGQRQEAEQWRARLPRLEENLEEHGWDGAWYRRAYHDDGTAIGSAHTAPPHIDSIAQSWAVLSGAGAADRAQFAMAAAERLLVHEPERLVLLLSPPFGWTGVEVGYIAAYPPGIRENGGQYTHAAAWFGFAHAASGDGKLAHRIFDLLNPLRRTTTAAEIERYRVEPYVMAADIYGSEPFVGRGGWTWYTGAAAWTWRLGIEAILGLRRDAGALIVNPCIPPSWDGFEAWVSHEGFTVHVVVDNGSGVGRGIAEARLDGRPITSARVELRGSGQQRLDVVLGTPAIRSQFAQASS